MPLIPTLRRLADLCKFDANLVYGASSMAARASQGSSIPLERLEEFRNTQKMNCF